MCFNFSNRVVGSALCLSHHWPPVRRPLRFQRPAAMVSICKPRFCPCRRGEPSRECQTRCLQGFTVCCLCSLREWEALLGDRSAVINFHLAKEKFHMGMPANLRLYIQKIDWVVSVDLTVAYFHVWSMHPLPRKFLRVLYQDEVFQFRVLPLGPLVSPRFFIRVVDAMMAHVRSFGPQIHHYLVILLLRILQVKDFKSQTQHLLHLTTRLALIPSLEKSELTPTQEFLFIGTHYRRDLGLIFLPEVWFREVACHTHWAIRARYVTA